MSEKRLDSSGDNNHSDHNLPEEDNDSNHVSVKVEINDTQLVQRRNVNTDNKMNGTKGNNTDQPATLDVGDLKMVNLGHVNKLDVTKDENGLAKGVVLNATQLYPPKDVKWIPDNLGKDHELKQNLETSNNEVPRESSSEKKDLDRPQEPEEKEKMSLTRKIFFGMSFIPSILFVLCFAVILPCEEPSTSAYCSKTLWTVNLNNTDLSTACGITDEVLLVSSEEENKMGSLLTFDIKTGNEIWSSKLQSNIKQMECQKLDLNQDNVYDCLVLTVDGILYAFNATDGYIFWNITFSPSPVSNFVITSDCNEDGIQEIAIGVSPMNIQLISNGILRSTIITNCSSTPTHLTSWDREEGNAELVYICEKKFEGKVVETLDSKDLCSKETRYKANGRELFNGYSYDVDLREAIIKPTNYGLVIWAEDHLSLFANDLNDRSWTSIVKNHSSISRHLFYGNFSTLEEDIVLISEDLSSNIQITVLGAKSGNETYSQSIKSNGLKNAVMVHGKDHDSVLTLMQDKQERNKTLAESSIVTSHPVLETALHTFDSVQPNHRLILLDFKAADSELSLIKDEILTDPIEKNGEPRILSAISEEGGFKLYLGQTLISATGHVSSKIQAFQMEYLGGPGISHCKSS